MRILAVLVAGLCASILFAGEEALLVAPVPHTPGTVKSVAVQGGTGKVHLSTKVGNPLDQENLNRDVRALWSTGQFSDIQVITKQEKDGTAVIFAVTPKPPVIVPGSVKSVAVEGASTSVRLATKVGDPVEQTTLSKDVRSLWSSGQFTDIQVKTQEERDGTSVIFVVTPKEQMYLHDMRIEPNSYGMTPNIAIGSPIDEVQAQRIAGQIRSRLVEKGFKDAVVDPELVPYSKSKVDLLIHVKAGDSFEVKKVEIVGDTVFPEKDVKRALAALRDKRIIPPIPFVWHGYTIHAAYSDNAVQSDLAKLQSFYIERGYFDAKVSLEDTDIQGENASVRLFVKAGPHYNVREIDVTGNNVEATKLEPPKYGLFQAKPLCSCLIAMRREAEKKGVFDFNTHLSYRPVEANTAGSEKTVDLNAEVEEGRTYTINRIEFTGVKHYKDATVRRNFLLDEGDLLDSTKLRKSLSRLNQTNLFEQVEEGQVAINTDERTGTADIVVPLTERKRGMWNLAGPVGPISIGGPLQGMIATRLPPWGQGIFELSTYYVSLSVISYFSPIAKILPLSLSKQGVLPILSLFRPYNAGDGWKSGFLIAPQLGWQASALTYGTTQAASRLIPIITGNQRFTPQLAVSFDRPEGDGVLLCDPPKPRFHTARMGAAMLLQFLASTPML
jgi:outer membrane protein assembly factor BamA